MRMWACSRILRRWRWVSLHWKHTLFCITSYGKLCTKGVDDWYISHSFFYHLDIHFYLQTSFCRKRSIEGSNLLDSKENNCASKKNKSITTSVDNSSDNAPNKPTSSFLSHEGSLSVALMASRRGTASRKRKTTFLSGMKQQSKKGSFSRSSSSSSKSVSLNHVVFGMAGDNSQSAAAVSQLDSTASNSRSFLGNVKSSSRGGQSKSRASKRSGSSLWSKVCSKNFRAWD